MDHSPLGGGTLRPAELRFRTRLDPRAPQGAVLRGIVDPPELVVFGRAALDLYGEERGAGLADTERFRKSVGGAAANAAVAAQRLGVKVGLLTRLGRDGFGDYVHRVLSQEGIDLRFVERDEARLTALVLLAMEGAESFPHLFYRKDCADEAVELSEEVRPWLAGARVLLLTGTHLRSLRLEALSQRLAGWAKEDGVHVVLDVDYRPSLWGDTPPGDGAARGLERPEAARGGPALRRLLPWVDTVVGTEEEIAIAAGTLGPEGPTRLRGLGPERVVVKRGPAGAWSWGPEGRAEVDGHGVPVLNSLGAGDAFLGAWLAAWLASGSAETWLRWGNAAGALVVSRHACAPAMPTREELMAFIEIDTSRALAVADARHRMVRPQRIRRRPLFLLAVDHRVYFERLAQAAGRDADWVREVKAAIFRGGQDGFADAGVRDAEAGFIIDDEFGAPLFPEVGGRFLARPIEDGRSPELRFLDGRSPGLCLRGWPVQHGVKCKVQWQEDEGLEARIRDLAEACRDQERPLILEVLPEPGADFRLPEILRRLYAQGVRPELWKLPPPTDEALWARLEGVLDEEDPSCDGVLLLGNGSAPATVAARIQLARSRKAFAGFAFGRTIFAEAAQAFSSGTIDAGEVRRRVAARWRDVLRLGRTS
ncbi:MAG: PfkB family carbohydrate kinase [Myxococcota bacterium]